MCSNDDIDYLPFLLRHSPHDLNQSLRMHMAGSATRALVTCSLDRQLSRTCSSSDLKFRAEARPRVSDVTKMTYGLHQEFKCKPEETLGFQKMFATSIPLGCVDHDLLRIISSSFASLFLSSFAVYHTWLDAIVGIKNACA